MPPSEGIGPLGMALWDVSRLRVYDEARRWIYTYLPEGYEQKNGSMNVGIACHAFFCSQD